MWKARTKDELIIEVWEKLDCDTVGRIEIEAISTAVEAHFGSSAVESPMVIARLLADEGAYLRHSEIMELYVSLASDRPYDAVLRGVLRLYDLKSAMATIRELENIRRKFRVENDKVGLRMLRETTLRGRSEMVEISSSTKELPQDRQVAGEIAEWLSLWLQTPELFESWVELRQDSPAFRDQFGSIRKD